MKLITYLMLSCIFVSNAGYAVQNKVSELSGKTAAISGQVFIATKGGENIKLSLVDVTAISEKKMLNFLASSQTKRRTLLDNSDSAAKEFTAAKKLAEQQDNSAFEEIAIIKAKKLIKANEILAPVMSGAYYFTDLPVAVAIDKTDADGKFQLDLPMGKYALAARSSRQISGEVEEYFWIVWVNVSAKNRSVLLSNDNLFETNCKDCVQPDF